MGCDIHLHTEIKIDGQWHHYGHPHIQRSYPLFCKMAGVRGTSDPISPPKGLPDDLSLITWLDANEWRHDAHSCSWLDWEEVAELCKWIELNTRRGDKKRWAEDWFGYCFGDGWGDHRHDREFKIEDIRFVFWFDN